MSVSSGPLRRWTPTSVTNLPLFFESFGVSLDGNTIVGRGFPAAGSTEAVRWTEADGSQFIGDLPGGNQNSNASAVSRDGSIVVGSGVDDAGYQAVRWIDGRMEVLGRLYGGTTYASDVSGDGEIVVGYSAGSTSVSTAFIWDAMGRMQDLATLATSAGLNLSGWRLYEAFGISDDGTRIVGWGINPSNQREGWLLELPRQRYDYETITITVNEVNLAPVLAPIGDQTTEIETPVTFTATASDDDEPANSLMFSLSGAPAGATIDPITGEFNWTPATSDTPGAYTFDVVATDDGSPALFDSETVTITVGQITNPSPLAPAGPVFWMAAEGTANDLVGNNNGSLQGDAAFVPGLVGQALSFNGSGAVNIYKTSNVFEPGTGEFTIETWIKADTLQGSTNSVIFQDYGGVTLSGLSLDASTGSLTFDARDVNHNHVVVLDDAADRIDLRDDQWHHVAAVRQGADFSIYVDGQLRKTVFQPIGSVWGTNSYARIGGANTGPGHETSPSANQSVYRG